MYRNLRKPTETNSCTFKLDIVQKRYFLGNFCAYSNILHQVGGRRSFAFV